MIQKEKITVAFFLPSLEPGGTERNVVNLVNAIDTQTYDISLVLGKKEGDFINQLQAGIPVISLGASGSLGLFFAFVAYLKKHQPDIFISAFPRINVICILAKLVSGTRTKVIITEHSVFSLLPVIAKSAPRRIFARFFMPGLGALLYPFAHKIICVSQGIADDLVTTIHVKNNLKVIYNPVISEAIYRQAAEPVEHPWFLDPSIPIILAAGRLVECKDYPMMLRAFKLVLAKKPARLVILGRGPEEAALKKMAERLGIASSTAFLGFQENPFSYMAKASVFALSSLQEGFGNVIIEAMACGVPVVSTDCPAGPGEIIDHMVNGMLVKTGDEHSFAEAILRVLDEPQLAQALRLAGKKRAEYFLVEKSVREYESVFNELLL